MNKTTQFTAEQQYLRSIRDKIAELRKQEKEARQKVKAESASRREARKAIREQVREIQNLVAFVKEYGHENGLAGKALDALKKVVNVDHYDSFLKEEAARKAKAEAARKAKADDRAKVNETTKAKTNETVKAKVNETAKAKVG